MTLSTANESVNITVKAYFRGVGNSAQGMVKNRPTLQHHIFTKIESEKFI